MGFFRRLVQPMEQGSQRKTILFWVRMTFGTTLLIAPWFCKQLGFLMAMIFSLISLAINYFSFSCIIKANTFTGHKDLTDLVEYLAPRFISRVFTVTYGLDMWSSFVSSGVICWNVFLYLLD